MPPLRDPRDRPARTPLTVLVAAAVLGAGMTLLVVFLAGGFGGASIDTPAVARSADAATTAAPVGAAPAGYARAVYAARIRSVVTVLVDLGKDGVQTSGTGFVVDAKNGFIITASHVVTSSADATDPRTVQRYGPVYVMRDDGARAPVTIVGFDLFDDIAILHYDPSLLPMPQAPLGDSLERAHRRSRGCDRGAVRAGRVALGRRRVADRHPDQGAGRGLLLHRRGDPDRHRDQPRQLGRPALQRARAR